MSDFTVLRSLDGYCLVLDNKRIAGGKPDYRGENVLVDWTTEVAYGPVDDLAADNAKLREQMERLVTLLRVDCDIDASWDGLRRFWSIGLTEDGCLMRDRACKAEAENAKLRELLSVMAYCNQFRRDCDGCSMNGAAGIITERAGCDELLDRLRELGVEV